MRRLRGSRGIGRWRRGRRRSRCRCCCMGRRIRGRSGCWDRIVRLPMLLLLEDCEFKVLHEDSWECSVVYLDLAVNLA